MTQHDVYISYAHSDNLTQRGETEGWVTNFCDSLSIMLTAYMGRNVNVWYDRERMRGNDFFTPVIKDNLRSSLTMISIISPSYINSEWCQKELEFFSDEVGTGIGRRSRLFFAVKLPPPQMSARFAALLRYDFFEFKRSNVPSPFSPGSDKFKERIDDLAYNIRETLAEIKEASSVEINAESRPGKTIYPAETTQDITREREKLRGNSEKQLAFICYAREDQNFVLELAEELKARGANIWLDKLSIRIGQNWNREIDKALESCGYFIIVLSPNSIKSEHVEEELMTALDDGKSIIPILYQDCRIPRRLKLIQYVDLASGINQNNKNIEQILEILDGKA